MTKWLWLTGFLTVLALAGCTAGPTASSPGTSSSPPTSALPPRPGTLALDGVDACALLTASQRSQLGLNRGKPGDNIEDPQRPACVWSNFPDAPDNGWVARIIMRYGAERQLGNQSGAEVVSVNGFPAVQTASPEVELKNHCLLFVDVAPGQTLEASYENGRGDYPGITHEIACQQAMKAATLMVDTLKTLKG